MSKLRNFNGLAFKTLALVFVASKLCSQQTLLLQSHIVNFYNFSGAEDVIRSVDCCCDEQMEVLQRWIKVSRK